MHWPMHRPHIFHNTTKDKNKMIKIRIKIKAKTTMLTKIVLPKTITKAITKEKH